MARVIASLLLSHVGLTAAGGHGHSKDHLYVFSFGTYPGYTGSLAPKGMMYVHSSDSDGGTQTISWTLTEGLDTRCSDACTAANCCGVHIHVGMTCDTANDIGGHYWNSTTYPVDPWLTVMYNTSDGHPATQTDLVVMTGTDGDDVYGRAMVIHDFTGARIACGIIEEATTDAFVKYPTYTGSMLPMGGVKVTSAGTVQTLHWIFTSGLDTRCSMACTDANCCGVHFHVGKTCGDHATIGGHYWNSTMYTTDPWLYIQYNTSAMPSAVMDVAVDTGYEVADVAGRSIVVHDYTGARIGCALMSHLEVPTTTTTTTPGETITSGAAMLSIIGGLALLLTSQALAA